MDFGNEIDQRIDWLENIYSGFLRKSKASNKLFMFVKQSSQMVVWNHTKVIKPTYRIHIRNECRMYHKAW